MKVLYLLPFDLKSGVAATQRVLMVAKALNELNHEVFFVDTSSDCNREYSWNGYNVKSVFIQDNLFDSIKLKLSKSSVLSMINSIGAIDMIIAYNYPGIALLRIVNYCKKNGIVCVADVADWPSGQHSIVHRFLMWIDISVRMYYTHKRMNGLIVISNYLYLFYLKNNVIKIPPMIDSYDDKWSMQNDIIINNEIIELTNVTTCGPDKENLSGLLQMLSECKDKYNAEFHLSVIGLTEQRYIQLHKANIPSNIRNSVSFIGRISQEETIARIKESDFFVFFRERNRINQAGFPTKFVEAVSCGTPVLTTDTSDLHEYLHNGKNGFFIHSVEDLYRVISLDKDTVHAMHSYCQNSRVFDYRRYISDINNFIKLLNTNNYES